MCSGKPRSTPVSISYLTRLILFASDQQRFHLQLSDLGCSTPDSQPRVNGPSLPLSVCLSSQTSFSPGVFAPPTEQLQLQSPTEYAASEPYLQLSSNLFRLHPLAYFFSLPAPASLFRPSSFQNTVPHRESIMMQSRHDLVHMPSSMATRSLANTAA